MKGGIPVAVIEYVSDCRLQVEGIRISLHGCHAVVAVAEQRTRKHLSIWSLHSDPGRKKNSGSTHSFFFSLDYTFLFIIPPVFCPPS